MRKAFDCVDHEILVDKLRLYNFDRTAVNWFKSYLSDRMQKVMVRNAESEPRTIKCGVLQGSVLGPLLFIILIIDLVLDSELSKNLFADNTTLQLNGDSVEEVEYKTNKELKIIANWFRDNRLSHKTLE